MFVSMDKSCAFLIFSPIKKEKSYECKQKRRASPHSDDGDADYNKIKENVLSELKNVFRPELINRIDEIIVFRKLTQPDIEQIAKIMLKGPVERMASLGFDVQITDAAVSHFAKAGFDDVYGARPLRRIIQSQLEDMLADELLSGKLVKDKKKDRFVVVHNNLDLSHFLRNKNSYLISWDKTKIDKPIFDLYKLYKRHYSEFDFVEVLKKYERNYPLLEE